MCKRISRTAWVATLLLASGLCADAQAPSRNVDVSTIWDKMDDSGKFGYILGFSNASENYQIVLRAERDGCGEEAKERIITFLEQNPMSHATLAQWKATLDSFYQDPRNKGINLVFAMQIASLQIAGRPQPEIEGQLQRMRDLTKRQ
jgi:hypothetical protein